jgi:phosphonate transport system substrate-binding protein
MNLKVLVAKMHNIMKSLNLSIILATLLFSVSLSHAGTLRFAPLPMENRETVVKQFRPMTTYLEQRLKVKIEYDYSDSYSDLIEKFRRSQIDLVYLGPLPYVELRASFSEAKPLVHFKEKSGEAFYTCALVTTPDTGFDPKKALDRKIALTQALSTCGYLSTNGLLHRNGSSLGQNFYRYLGQHDAVALSVIRGEFDAGGIKTAIAHKYTPLGLQIIAETPPLPAFALVGNSHTLSAEQASLIRKELISLDPLAKDQALLSSWGDNIRYGAVMATDSDYQVVRELLGNTVIPMSGNF